MRGHWQGVAGLGELGEMHVGGGGYCGIAPLLRRGEANVAFVLDRRGDGGGRRAHRGVSTAQRSHRWPRVASASRARHRSWPPRRPPGRSLPRCRGSRSGSRCWCGDAAGFYDPFTGEGVTLALRSAELAAEAIDDHLRGGTALSVYETRRRERTRDKFRLNRLLQQVVARPGLANQMAARLQRRPDLADPLVGIAGDFVPAQAALRLGMLFDLLRA